MTGNHQKSLDLAKAVQWEEAHAMVQDCGDELSCQIHGYLHRVEGDLDNARYWYGQGHSTLPDNTLEEEWARLSARLSEA